MFYDNETALHMFTTRNGLHMFAWRVLASRSIVVTAQHRTTPHYTTPHHATPHHTKPQNGRRGHCSDGRQCCLTIRRAHYILCMSANSLEIWGLSAVNNHVYETPFQLLQTWKRRHLVVPKNNNIWIRLPSRDKISLESWHNRSSYIHFILLSKRQVM